MNAKELKEIVELVAKETVETYERAIDDLDLLPRIGVPVRKLTPGEYKRAFIQGVQIAAARLSKGPAK